MRAIQLITPSPYLGSPRFPDITVSKFSSPRSLDEFEINVIDLSYDGIWKNKSQSYSTINMLNDFVSIEKMMQHKKYAAVVLALPQNEAFSYDLYYSTHTYQKQIPLKDMLEELQCNILPAILPETCHKVDLEFENTRTTIEATEYSADFHFVTGKPITKSNKSQKCTTVELENQSIFATTLMILENQNVLLNFLDRVVPETQLAIPGWLEEYAFGNDEEQKQVIDQSEAIIENENERINRANVELKNNMRYKSILVTNGAALVEVVFEILEHLLDCDLSGFVDEKKEDFLIKKEQCTFIGEIKGVTSNVKSEHISQLEVHFQTYQDELEEKGDTEKVCPLLIISPFRSKELLSRDPIAERQIALAKRNKSLIITTETLLKIFELFLNHRITSDDCIRVFSEKKGVLKVEDFSV